MPGIGWTELLLIAAVAIVVVGPKDLPILMRTIGRFIGKARSLAREFQESFEEIAREAELEELRKEQAKLQQEMMKPVIQTPPLSESEEAKLRETTNTQVMAAPAAPAPALEPGAPAEDNVTPLRGARR
jgi:sec-independent protein translocase protein TatB